MLIIERKDGESVDRMVKRYKRKHRNVKLRRQLRNRKHFTKKSIARRMEIKDAIYKAKKSREEEG